MAGPSSSGLLFLWPSLFPSSAGQADADHVALVSYSCTGLRLSPASSLPVYPTGLRPIPPPCLGGGSETSWMLVGISWLASRGPLGGSLGASWGPFWGFLGPHLGLLGASWGVLGGSWGPLGASLGPLGASLGHLGAEGSIFQFFVPLLGPSWARLGGLLGRLGRLLGRLGALLGRLGAVLGASWAVLERREAENTKTTKSFQNH